MCIKLAKIFGMIFGSIAGILAILGVIGFIVWTYKEGSFIGVSNFWNFLYASVPFSLLSMCFTLVAIAAKEKC
ncbi:MAG: hypothetical protein DRI97_01980 [Bacteroidetes bacterium]|nr:MAG: hypothetical protein DRI83_04450 [Bacteroidota bacterium]RLD59022.1 MAG: hypothetical protein DRI97_01980 [Bacteroidota bacterium]RLD81565.1 MAG: hypothetical protein DRJ15_04060 [Bacteroidota bacterium]